MKGALVRAYDNTVAVLTSMHQKERVIGPILRSELGLLVGLAMGVDTDQFGTFIAIFSLDAVCVTGAVMATLALWRLLPNI